MTSASLPSEAPWNLLLSGKIQKWNRYRLDHPDWKPDADVTYSFDGMSLKGIDLSRLDLPRVSFISSNLEGANLSCSSFGCEETHAPLARARLTEAWLVGTNLRHTRGLEEKSLSGSVLFGATLPDNFVFFGLEQVEKASKNSRNNLFVMVLACALSIIGTIEINDFQMVTNQGLPVLPFLNRPFGVTIFLYVTPVLLLFFFSYFHLYLQNLWKTLRNLPAYFHDGYSLNRKAYPWLLNVMVSYHVKYLRIQNHERPHRRFFEKYNISLPVLQENKQKNFWLRKLVIFILAYGSVPSVLILIWCRSLVLQSYTLSLFILSILFLASIASVGFYRDLRKRLRKEEVQKPLDLKSLSTYRPWLFALVVFLLLAIPTHLLFRESDDLAHHHAKHYLNDWSVNNEDPDHRMITDEKKPGRWKLVSANVPYREFSVKPAGREYHTPHSHNRASTMSQEEIKAYYDHILEDINNQVERVLLEGIQLDYADARDTYMAHIKFENASFRGANLAGSDLSSADLSSADLRLAFMPRALLIGTRLTGADLSGATLRGAVLSRAVFKKTSLNEADLREISIYDTIHRYPLEFTGVNLRKAEFRFMKARYSNFDQIDWTEGFAYDLEIQESTFIRANMRNIIVIDGDFTASHFSGASFSGSFLIDTTMQNCLLDEVDFSRATIRGDLRGSVFNLADLNSAHLEGFLHGAKFIDTKLYHTDLSATIGLTFDQLKYACLDHTTVLPNELTMRQEELINMIYGVPEEQR